MTKLRAALAAAAALVLTGITVALSLNQAGQSVGLTCSEWDAAVVRYQERQTHETAFVAVKSGAAIPKAIGDRLLGDCAAGVCTVQPAACGGAVTYTYDCGPLVNLGAPGSWRICEVRAPLYFLGAWKRVATDTPGSFRFYGGFGDAQAGCLSATTGANCLSLFAAGSRCWLLDDGRTCSYGRMYGPGLGGSTACDYARVRSPMPCVVDRGAGSELVDASRTLADGEME